MLSDLIAPPGAKALLVCSTGGHLSELIRLEARLGPNPESLWVTFDTPQSRQLLDGRRVLALPYIGPRDLKGTFQAMPVLRGALRRESFDVALSTGAAVAVAALPLAALSDIPAIYIESVSRVQGPSSTGRILELARRVQLRTPHPHWRRGRWEAAPSILADFRSMPASTNAVPRKVFVTLGTIRGYRFDSVVDAMLQSGYANAETVWQLGDTERADSLPGTVHDHMAPDDFTRAALEADVVVTHAGVGTLLELLGMGIYPVQAVRRAHRREHVDDHQTQIARLVNDLDIGVAVDGPNLSGSDIERAASRRIVDGLRAGATS